MGLIPNKKTVVAVFILLLCVLLVGCGGSNSSVYGKWTVTGVVIDNTEYNDVEKIKELYGNSAYAWKDATLTLTKSGNVVLSRPSDDKGTMTDVKGMYTVQDGIIELCNPNDPKDFSLLDYKDGKIYFDISGNGMTIVFSK